MKKQTILATMVLGVYASTNLAMGVVSAADADTSVQNAKVEFSEGGGVIDPLDPENPAGPTDPSNPTDPGEGGGGTSTGALKIDWAPSFDFGKVGIGSGNDMEIAVKRTASQNVAHMVQVSDLRGETNPDWTLNVVGTQLSSASNDVIEGAYITYSPIAIKSTSGVEGDATPNWATESIINLGGKTEGNTVASATGAGAAGIWSMGLSSNQNVDAEMKDNMIKLVIPKSQLGKLKKVSYTSDLTWTLSTNIPTSKAGTPAQP